MRGFAAGHFDDPLAVEVRRARWFVARAVDSDVAGGFANGTYKPSAAVSRQAMAAFLFNLDPLLP